MSRNGVSDRMRSFWDDRARENAVWYVDTSVDYKSPDMDKFWATGDAVVKGAITDGPVQPPGHHLAVEIGPGLGRICRSLASRFDQVVGIDVSPEMIERARELVDLPNVRFVVGSGSDLSVIADGTADLVVSFTVFQHLPRPELVDTYIRESARILKPGGILAAQWNNQSYLAFWRSRFRLRRLSNGRPVTSVSAPEFLGSRVSLRAIRSMCQHYGLDLVDTRGERSLFAWMWARRV